MYVWNPANFTVAYASNSSSATTSYGVMSPNNIYFVAPTEKKLGVYINGSGADADNVLSLGSPSCRWTKVYSASSSISTSDKNLKKDIRKISDLYKKLFMKLIPVSYLFKDGESGRTHIGFISQDVEDAMKELNISPLDFAGFCKDIKMKEQLTIDVHGNKIVEEVPVLDNTGNEEYIYSLRYEEFIALNTAMIQDLYKEIDKLRTFLEK